MWYGAVFPGGFWTEHKHRKYASAPHRHWFSLYWFENLICISGLRHHAMSVAIPYNHCQHNSDVKVPPKIEKSTKSNPPFRWSGYISMPNFRPRLPCVLKKMPKNILGSTDETLVICFIVGRMDGRGDRQPENKMSPVPKGRGIIKSTPPGNAC